jgi:16S rRNA (cytidine1402-2'-O)-methyltransferase
MTAGGGTVTTEGDTAAGTLYLVPTPIGNPRDITLRALDVLAVVAVVAAEDTRKARTLLRAHGLEASLLSYYDFNEQARTPQLLRTLLAGQDVAVITDAGTPLVNDPGYRIVTAALEAGIRVSPLPGPSAVLTALVGAGLPSHRFEYVGFLPRKSAARRSAVAALAAAPATLIFFEAPHRLLETLADLREVLGDRAAALARNLTKPGEEFLRGPLSAIEAELAARGAVRGEYTLVVAGAEPAAGTASEELAQRVALALLERGIAPSVAREVVSEVTGLPRNQAYDLVQQARG